MSNLVTNGSPQLELTRSYFQGFEQRDISQIERIIHKDYRRITGPQSAGKPVQEREEYLRHTGELIDLWTEGCKITFHTVIEVPGKVFIHLTGRADTSIPGLKMDREAIWIGSIVTDEDGSLKFIGVEEFADSKDYIAFFKAVGEAKAKRDNSAA